MRQGKVYFVGAGPGDPELLTVKAKRLLEKADVIIYAGSLVREVILEGLEAELYDSSRMTLEEIVEVMVKRARQGKLVVRLHSGDPAFYGALHEQVVALIDQGVDFEVVPGVSSASAGAAVMGVELTVPELAQTVVFTRLGGRTPGPSEEDLARLAGPGVTLVLFLSVSQAERLKQVLLRSLSEDTPVAVVEKVGWPEQKVVRGRLKELPELVERHGIKKTALIYVGEVLEAARVHRDKRSKLYGKR